MRQTEHTRRTIGAARSVLAIAVSGILLAATSANAVELRNSIRGGVAHSDNIGRDDTGEVSETILTIDGTVNLSHATRVSEFLLQGSLGYRHYLDDTYDGNVVGNMLAAARFTLMPETVTWVFENRFGTLQQNPYQSDTPDNIENINNFSTGPDFHFVIGNVTALDAGARLRVNTFEESDLDNDVLGGNLALVRALSSKRNVSLNYSMDQVDYDDDILGRDYDRQLAYVGFSSEMSRGTVSVRLGGNRVEFDDDMATEDSADGIYAHVEFNRQLTARSSFTASYDKQYSDAGNIFREFQDPGRSPQSSNGDVVGAGEPFEGQRFRVGWNMERARTSWNFSVNAYNEDYVSRDILDRNRFGLQGGVSWRLGSGWTASGGLRFEQGQFSDADRDDDDLYLNLGLTRRLSRTLDLNVNYQRADRSSTEPTAEYTENRVAVTIGYSRDRD